MASRYDSSDLADIDRPFAQARTPPGRVYRDPSIYAQELDRVFARSWLCVGHVSRLGAPGEFFVVDLERDSVVITVDRDGKPRAFHNVCRHRGSRLVKVPAGRCKAFQCPYHAWRYGLDGRLIAAPDMQDADGFDKGDYPLVPVQVQTMQGFLFINLDPGADALASVYADFPDMSRFGGADLVRVGRHEYEAAANWKLICENYNECYHCALAHPQLHRISAETGLKGFDHRGAHFTGGPMRLKPGYNTMTTSGVTRRSPLPGVTVADRDLVFYFNLFPNFLYSLAPDYVLAHYVWPTGPESVHIQTEWFCSPEQVGRPDFDAADAIEFWDTTNRQDWDLCENAQAGLVSSGHRPGRYQSSEGCVHDFDRWWVRTLHSSP